MVTLDVIRRLAKTYPGAEEGSSYGTPGLNGKEDAIVVLLNSIEEQQEAT